MAMGFRVGVPGMRVRVSTRGVRASVGPRAARVHFGSGRTRVSTGFGPFYASQSVGGRSRGRRSTSTRRTHRPGASPAQLARAARAAERAAQQAERDAAIASLNQLHTSSTTVHLDDWPPAVRPEIPLPPPLNIHAVQAQMTAELLRGVGRFARSQRAAAREQAAAAASAYCVEETERTSLIYQSLVASAGDWWDALCRNEETTVIEAVNTAFADNPAAGCAVGVDGATLSIVMRLQDIESLPDKMPSTTAAGNPTLKALTKRDRTAWWQHILAANLAATCREAFAVAPAIMTANVVVITRFPDRRLGVVAYGSWDRRIVESTPWRTADDAFRIFDIGVDVQSSIRLTVSGNVSSTLKPLNTNGIPGLTELIAGADDEGLGGADASGLAGLDIAVSEAANPETPFGEDLPDPYLLTPCTDWLAARSGAAPAPSPAPDGDNPPAEPECVTMTAGQSSVLPDSAVESLDTYFEFAGADADLSLLLVDRTGQVRGDADFVFYNQPATPDGAVRINGKYATATGMGESGTIHLAAVPAAVARVLVVATMDTEAGHGFGALTDHGAGIVSFGIRWTFRPVLEPVIRAAILFEIYRHTPGGGREQWKVRAIGQGWSDGLAGLARDHGVDVDD